MVFKLKPGFRVVILTVLISSGFCDKLDNSTIPDVGQSIAPNSVNIGQDSAGKTLDLSKNDKKIPRNPKFGFNIPTISGSNFGSSTPYPNYDSSYNNNGLGGGVGTDGGLGSNFGLAGAGLGVASTLALVKGGVLGGLTALKAAVLPPIFIGAVIVFLIAGAAFFTCSVVNCGNLLGGGGLGGGSGSGSPFNSFTNFFNRNGYEPYYGNGGDYYYNYENQVAPVYQALEEAYKKWGGSGDLKSNQVNK